MDRQIGEDLAVELNSGFLEAADEPAVADAVVNATGIDAHDPQRAELTLLLAASDERGFQSALHLLFCGLVELGFVQEITGCPLEYLLAVLAAFGPTFNARHSFSF